MDAKTTQIYSHYAPSAYEVARVDAAFSDVSEGETNVRPGSNLGANLSETEEDSEQESPGNRAPQD